MEKIAICSAKGGVGKTTITYSLAMKYHKAGKKIGLFDADVYGPNLINLFAYAKPNQSAHNSKITPAKLPYSIDGIEFSSTDLLFNPDDAAMLRGPMLSKILKELYEKSFSTDLDYLFIDMPPGTGDAYITIFKDLNIQKAVLVYVDDPLCIADLKRTIKMLHLLEVDVVAAIENLAESKQTLTNDEIIALDINKTLAIPRIARHDLYNKYLRTGKLEKLLNYN
jgi:ATP-binding protein involved in chromosome partitioning